MTKVVGQKTVRKHVLNFFLKNNPEKKISVIGTFNECMDTLVKHLYNIADMSFKEEYVQEDVLEPADSILNKETQHYHSEDGSSGVHVWVFQPLASNEQIVEFLENRGISTEGVRINSMYDCTGKYFSNNISIKRNRFKVLVTQNFGYDV